MSRQLRVTPAAGDDIADAYGWYESQRSGLRDLRRLLLRRFPYAVYYRLTEAEIVIRGCLHSHRNPGAWRERA